MYYIFYSWQSDESPKENRNYILKALKKVKKKFETKFCLDIIQATGREIGSIDISESIFSHIDRSDIFVCDITCMYTFKEKKSPNPNVFLELGYASSKLGWNRIICIVNSKFSQYKDLPFDIRNRRILEYSTSLKNNCLQQDLELIIEEIISKTGDPIQIQIDESSQNYFVPKFSCEDCIKALPREFIDYKFDKEFEFLDAKKQFFQFSKIKEVDPVWAEQIEMPNFFFRL